MSETRSIIWSWLVLHPGRTAHEIARAAFAPGRSHGSVRKLLLRMESAEQVTRQESMRPGQPGPVSEWFAAPGAFAIGGEPDAAG